MAAQSEKSFPFDSYMVNGKYDREYHADDFARYFRSFISSGMFMKKSSNLQVIANGDMSVTLKPGNMIIDGYRYENTDDIIIQLDPADGVLDRIDRVSITWSKEDRDISCTVQKGVPSYEPVPQECRRTSDYLDYVSADILVAAGAIKITQKDITDQRLNSEVCGLALPFTELDTSTLNAKLQEYYDRVMRENDEWKQDEKDKFTTWFENIKGQLEGDVAANLQNQIGTLSELNTKEKSDLVKAINEVAGKEIDVLDSKEEIFANTEPGKVAGAQGVKEALTEVNNSLANGQVKFKVENGDLYYSVYTE